MSGENWTGGEWHVDHEPGTDVEVLDSRGFPIAALETDPIINRWPERYPEMHHWADGAEDGRTKIERDEDELKANAHLVAAAPELYEALAEHFPYTEKAYRDTMHYASCHANICDIDSCPRCRRAIKAIRALVKARGEQEDT